MAAPLYSGTYVGQTTTDQSGNSYRFNGSGWDQISQGSGMIAGSGYGSNYLSNASNYRTQPINAPTSAPIESDFSSYFQSAPGLGQLSDVYNEKSNAVNNYINDLLSTSQGDYDFAIKQLKRQHELALGTDDKARAEFMETVADKLEERIGRIPYDYEVGSTRLSENLARTQEVTNRNRDLALQRLAEDEQTWRQEFGRASEDTRQTQRESLSQRGLLTGTREGAEGLAAREVARTEGDLSTTLQGFERALGRERSDISTEAEDTLFEAQREATRGLEDLTTGARRMAQDAGDQFAFGTEAQQRKLEEEKKRLERLREEKLDNARVSTFNTYGIS